MEGTTSRTDSTSMPLISMGGRTAAVQPAAATTTMTLTEVPTDYRTAGGSAEILRLTLRARPTVRWDENVEDNEGMGRKSSKRCCIFHKQREFGESSTDSSADENHASSDDENSDIDDKKPKATNHERRKIARPKKNSNGVPDSQRFHA